jgi:hypothetical protein
MAHRNLPHSTWSVWIANVRLAMQEVATPVPGIKARLASAALAAAVALSSQPGTLQDDGRQGAVGGARRHEATSAYTSLTALVRRDGSKACLDPAETPCRTSGR